MSSPKKEVPNERQRMSSTASYFDETKTARAKEFVRSHSESNFATSQGIEIDDTIFEECRQTSSRIKKLSRRSRRRTTTKKAPKKNVDDIQDVFTMFEVFKLLHIKHDPQKCDLIEMKKTAKKEIEEQSSGSGKYSNGTTGFEVIAKAKDEDLLKREKLGEFYLKIDNCIKQLDKCAIEVLNTYYGDHGVLNVLDKQTERLAKLEYKVLIAGESSAGKSSLLNLILGEELLPHHVLNTTSTICELKFGKERKLVVHYNYDEERKIQPEPVVYTLDKKENCQEQIARFVRLEDSRAREKASCYAKVEIFWPHELLEEGVVIIDSPGLGESDEMDEVLMNYLPNALAFIYVLDMSRAGGIQKDMKEKLMGILRKAGSDAGVASLRHLAECSLFVCNKWDQVKESEREAVKKYVSTKLSECWRDASSNHQIVYMSVTEAIKVQEYGGVTEEFNLLLKQIKTMVLKAINIRLYNHWQWLHAVLQHIYRVTYFFNQEIQSTHQTTRERMSSIEKRIEIIEKQEESVRKNMEARLEYQTKVLHAKLKEHIQSPGFKTKFCNWNDCSPPPNEINWETTKSNITKAIDYRFKELLIQWENDNQVYSETHRQLLDEFRTRLNLLEEELQNIDKAIHGESQVDKNKSKISTTTKVLFGATSPLWIPFGVAGLIIGMPVFGAMVMKRKVSQKRKLENYQDNPRDYLEKQSQKYLQRLTKEFVLKYAQRQMENTRIVLSKYGDQIPILIEADRKMVKQLTNETRSQDEVLKLYVPVQKSCVEIQKDIIPLGIELFPASVNPRDLEWKKDGEEDSLGEGEFSIVYQGKITNPGGNKSQISEINVAVKVFKHPFDDPNSRLFLNEEVKIRDLNHKNVTKYFGSARMSICLSSKKYRFIFVMKSCRENLRSVIFRNRNLTPAKSENTKLAIGKFFNWAMDIADGLNYIHERGLIHRHLKLENILEDEDGTAMISDVGIVGQFVETEKSIIYLAPEVLENLANRTKEADMYSYGLVLWEMWYGTQAFTELMPIDRAAFKKKIADNYRPKMNKTTINIPIVQAIMTLCWATKVKDRYSARECYDKFENIKNGIEDTAM
ncbi:dual serine/threonine and tyrosine protein kinase-like [Dendronephthya gigantea]|uniref:dual serine/threonine and tyrosine protein kinase-like n=1 Tax=Dendronephthya gigantea TaxID=151771 RepID=UPI00106D3F32|nr:dual serine/threonine and tyrosine protein kinase-like [Dendronephthya gigantea]